jgi:hypothetical protein
MTLIAPQLSGARRFIVNFDSGYATCTAKIAYAKEASQSTIRAYSPITKHVVEMQSVTPSGESRVVQAGNVFGD